MAVVISDADGPAGRPPATAQATSWRARRLRWLVAAVCVVALIAAVASVLLAKAADYQPLSWGNAQFGPTGNVRPVNDFGHYRGDYYMPPQRGTVTFFNTIYNSGSRSVIIVGLTFPTRKSGNIRLAGPVRYTARGFPGPTMPPGSPVLHDVRLGPGQSVFIAIALRTPPCGQLDSWSYVPTFEVKERFLFFTHTVALAWNMSGGALIMHPPGGQPGEAGTICASK